MNIDISKHLPNLFKVKRRFKSNTNGMNINEIIIVFFNLFDSPKLCPIQIWPPSTTRMADNA